MLRRTLPCRRGATLVEAAVVFPVAILMTLGMVIVGLGVARYQQVARLARQGARYAAVHGSNFQTELNPNGQAGLPFKATEADLRAYIVGLSAGLDTSATVLTVEVTTRQGAGWVAWNTNSASTYTNGSGQTRKNTVRVKVTYQWSPEAYWGSVTLTSTAEVPMGF
jgi:Flp pilus assembly protein TadG